MRTSPLLLALFVALTSVACDSAGFKRGYMALDSEGERERDVFYTDSEGIFCVVEMASGREDVTVKAELHAQAFYVPPDGHAEEASVFIAAEEEAPGAGEELTVSFEWVRDADEPYPAGVYECRLFLEDELEETLPFEVRYPECPVAPVVNGLSCDGFVLPNARCPGAFEGRICTCRDGVWRC
jgi:hypothetical protein